MSIQTAEQIIKSPLVASWFGSYLRSQKDTWQRGEALQGIHGAITLAVGASHQIALIEGGSRRDLAVRIDGGEPVRVSFYIA